MWIVDFQPRWRFRAVARLYQTAFYLTEVAVDPAIALPKIARRTSHSIVHDPITEEVQINAFPNGSVPIMA